MTAVRYVALAALVVWLGVLAGALGGDLLRHVHVVSAVCGSVLLAALFAMKFIGPPPRAFFLRAAIVAVMLAVMAASIVWRAGSTAALAAATALGFALLAWYAHE